MGGIGAGVPPIPCELMGGIGAGVPPIPSELMGGIGAGVPPMPATFFRREALVNTTNNANRNAKR